MLQKITKTSDIHARQKLWLIKFLKSPDWFSVTTKIVSTTTQDDFARYCIFVTHKKCLLIINKPSANTIKFNDFNVFRLEFYQAQNNGIKNASLLYKEKKELAYEQNFVRSGTTICSLFCLSNKKIDKVAY
ncbi:hypothetical protein KFV02_05900 [Desulfohalobiaceae bacterium Ax17]|uniref:hypothetical protein n=1 Tax=Desulfovulcanus ferrireducens TaxID=2831190 RepID=UPI00207B9AF3|nr:hypothetical protein [Desulfovulcanus ferrireducens]MBT8763462.1 hypothetical protein [Desulfovulcanus ferrireducens]